MDTYPLTIKYFVIFRLDDRLVFPDPALANEDGLLAVGGDLSVQRLLLAYDNGIFPWYNSDEPILWFSPHQRFVLYPHELNISRSMLQVIRSGIFKVTVNHCFNDVVKACSTAKRKGQDGTWITKDMRTAYGRLHQQGYAHSVEVWQDEEIVGGLYGVETGKVFCGESMFSKVSNASKAALIWLCKTDKYQLIDCQVYTPHLESMGARMISREDYIALLQQTVT